MQLVHFEFRQVALLLVVLEAFLAYLVVTQLHHLLVFRQFGVVVLLQAHRVPVAVCLLGSENGGRSGVQLRGVGSLMPHLVGQVGHIQLGASLVLAAGLIPSIDEPHDTLRIVRLLGSVCLHTDHLNIQIPRLAEILGNFARVTVLIYYPALDLNVVIQCHRGVVALIVRRVTRIGGYAGRA